MEILQNTPLVPGTTYYRVNGETGAITELLATACELPGRTVVSFDGCTYPYSHKSRVFDSSREAQTAAAPILKATEKARRNAVQVREREDGNYDVFSGPATYHVTGTCPEFMNDRVRTWKCDCPAGQHGRNCKHVTAVLNLLGEEA
jgi:hypothetical protein